VAAALLALRGHAREAVTVARDVHPDWRLAVASCVVVIGTYLLLVQVWRVVLRRMGGNLSFRDAAYVWFVSNLARYIPGAFWQMGALGLIAQRHRISALAAMGSAVVVTVANVVAGLLVFVVVTPAGLVSGRTRWWPIAVGVLALMAAPAASARLSRVASSLARRRLEFPRVDNMTTGLAVLGNAAAWLLYGLAFMLLARSILPIASAAGYLPHTAVYTASYLAGFLALAPPAGLGVAEAALIRLAPELGVATIGQAAVLAVVVRAWRTALEIVPGLVMLALGSGRRTIAGGGELPGTG
jgi:hypothetical protein